MDRLHQDIEINQYTITNVLLGRGAHSTVKLAKSKEGFFCNEDLVVLKNKEEIFHKTKTTHRNGECLN